MKPLLSTLTLFITLNAFSQGSEPQKSPVKDTTALLKEIQQVMEREHIPGLMISIVKGDSIVYAGGLGYANLENQTPVRSTTLFRQSSVTKMFTAMGILKLVHRGKLNLKDELKKIAPEIPVQNPWEDTNPVRVVHLLEHTAGFDDVKLNKMYSNKPEKHQGLDAIMIHKSSFISRWKPGERMSYSNPDYEILGYLIEKLSGRSLAEFLKQEVLSPIGMNKAVFNPQMQGPGEYASGYRFSKNGPIPFPFYVSSGNGAGAALFASSVDMAQFLKLFIRNWQLPSGPWLPEVYLEEMEKVHSTLAAKNGLKLGYALANDKFPNNSKVTFRGHFGQGDGFNSLVLYNREHKIGYAICNNVGKGLWPLSQVIEEFLTNDLPQPKELASIPLEKSIGSYLGYYQFLSTRSNQWNFLQTILGGFKLKKSGNNLVLSSLFKSHDTLYRVEGLLYKRKHDLEPYYVLGKDDMGKPFFQGYRSEFYQKTAYFPILIQQAFLLITAIVFLLTVLLAFQTLALTLIRKAKLNILAPVFFPVFAFVSGFIAFRLMQITDQTDKPAFNNFNSSSALIFLCSLGFAIFIWVAVFLLYKRWTYINNKWIKGILCFNLVVLACLTVYLALHGWIGIRVWAL